MIYIFKIQNTSAPDEESSHGGHRGRVMKRFSVPPPLLSVFSKWQNLFRGGGAENYLNSQKREIAPILKEMY